ncbi:L-threonylcarbamoyladenylate synthase [Ilumatobacter sp.]|uniref:L-threonylcarbamoyladenylate synthase n=1 Tax=Ilumatobacter sp. TaxID=1967498 RepID=UPI0037524AF5
MKTPSLVTTDIELAIRKLRAGGLVAVPTETVYGLAADASNPAAVARIFAVKGRPTGHPLIVHIADADQFDVWSSEPSDVARRLAANGWPGPLTLIVPRSDRVHDAVTGGRTTVGLRVPAHPMTLDLLRASGLAIAAPSANRFGAVSPTTAQHVLDDLGDLLDPATDAILDGGPCTVGLESTIIDTTVDPPQLLRAGAITADDVAALVNDLAHASGPSRASGMLESHYAPQCEVRLVDTADDAWALRAGTPGAEILEFNDDLAEAARSLYSELRAADTRGAKMLIVVLPRATGLGHALRDRLTKAAAPRPR